MVGVTESSYLAGIRSAQQANIIAPTRVCELAEDPVGNIHTDGRYAFAVAPDWNVLEAAGLPTSSGQPMKSRKHVS